MEQHERTNGRVKSTDRQDKKCLFLYSCILSASVIFIGFQWYKVEGSAGRDKLRLKDIKTIKTVYIWARPKWLRGGLFKSCSYKCSLVENMYEFKGADAILFHGPTMKVDDVPRKWPKQIWIFYSMESPEWFRKSYDRWFGLFNWTMTFRRDSDIFCPYKYISNTKKNSQHNVESLVKKWKSKFDQAAWLASHCVTVGKREKYISELQKSIGVGKYGRCGDLICPRTKRKACFTMIDRKYRYYLSFENAFCRDYITEKAFNIYTYMSTVIPVVRGGANYSMFLPPRSFVDTSGFTKISDMAHEMKQLYRINSSSKYFEYQKFYQTDWRNGFCELCRRLHLSDEYRRLYDDVIIWYGGTRDEPTCRQPTDIR